MRFILYTVGLIMISAWLIGLLRFGTGGHLHLILIIAAVAVALKVTKLIEQRKLKVMRKRILFLAITGFVAGTVFTSCERNDADRMDNKREDVVDEQRDVAKEERDVVEEQTDVEKAKLEMDEYAKESEMRIKENEDRIKDYRTRMDKDSKLKAKYDDDVAELEKKNRDMEARMRDYKYTTREDWDNFKTEFNRDMDELGTSIKNVFRGDKTMENKKDRAEDKMDRDRK